MASTWPLVQQGSTGENVRSIQYLLNAHNGLETSTSVPTAGSASAAATPDPAGDASATATVTETPPTATATTATEPLVVDGIFGAATDDAVRSFQAEHGLAVDGQVGNQTWPELIIQVSAGSTGDAVRAVQSQVYFRSGSTSNGWLQISGTFDQDTDAAVRHFQGFCDLDADGIAGPNTWNRLTLEWLRASSGQAAAELVFQAWSDGDRTAARYEAIPPGVDALFARAYEDGWTFGACQVTEGTFACTWYRTGDKLILEGNNSTAAPFFFVTNAASEI